MRLSEKKCSNCNCHWNFQRSRSVLKEVEPGYWMELAVSVPFTKKKKGNPKTTSAAASSETASSSAAASSNATASTPAAAVAAAATASPSASHVIEYEPENVHDSVLDAMISHAYEMFR